MTKEEREKVIDALKISAPIHALTEEEFNDYIQTLNKAMDWLEQEPCEDVISREWLKIAIHNFYHGLKHTPTEEDIQAYIDVAPLVTPQPQTGHWIYIKNSEVNGLKIVKCSECGKRTYGSGKYCPNCGCKMESEKV